MAVTVVASAHSQALDPRAALFSAPFAHGSPLRSVGGPLSQPLTLVPPSGLVATLTPVSLSRPGAVAFVPTAGLTAADEGAMDLGASTAHPMFSLSRGGYDLILSPQAAFNAPGQVSSAQAGAMVQVGADVQDKVMTGLNKLGMHTVSSASIENRSRLYLFAAYSGREVGFNIGRGPQGGVQRLGWSAEGASTLVSDAQAGFGWRKGELQASLGYVHRDVNSNDTGFGNVGLERLSDNMVAFTFSLRPR
jgi:hypothetical protein